MTSTWCRKQIPLRRGTRYRAPLLSFYPSRTQSIATVPANVCIQIRNYFLTLSLLLAIRWRTMIISELRRIIGWFWVAQTKKCILCTMYVRKKHNRSGSTSVVVVSKASGKYREIKSGSSEIWSDA